MNPSTLPETNLAKLVRARINELGIRQSEFGARYDFDQGLLSKILSSKTRSINLESCLRLAIALEVPAIQVLEAIGRPELYRLLTAFRDRETEDSAVTLPSRRRRRRRNHNDFADTTLDHLDSNEA